MDVFDLVAKLTLDSSEYDSGLDDSETKAHGFGSKLTSALGTVGKVGAAALGAASTAAVALTKSAISSYASYEQLVGGVDKLYGEASGRLQKYADKAFLTAGMSANQYMETATSFSASLINSLGGDTKKAADMTDVAMRAMSDNVNVFGSSMDSVQNAFQGFAKGNYTMLDNLKLGYGGTKTEMERLIADANEYRKSIGETADLSIDSFADVVQAIQSVQEAQGIAGTTNKEAMKTIEGSAAATKAAWENVITAIGRGEGLKDAMSGLATAIFGEAEEEGLLNQIIPRIQTTLEGIADFVLTAGPMIAQKIPEIADAIIPSLLQTALTIIVSLGSALPGLATSLFTSVVQVATELVNQFSAVLDGYDISSLSSLVIRMIDMVAGSAPQFLTNGLNLITSLITGILNGIPGAIQAVGTIAQYLVSTLMQGAPQFIQQGIGFIMNLISGIISTLPSVMSAATDVALSIINTILDNLPGVIDSGIQIVLNLIDGLIDTLPDLLDTAMTMCEQFLSTLSDNLPAMLQKGVEIIAHIVNGIISALPTVVASAVSLAVQFISTIASHFPSILSKGIEIVGKLVSGILGAIPTVASAAGSAISEFLGKITGKLGEIVAKGKEIISNLANGVKNNVSKIVSTVTTIFSNFKSAITGKDWGSIGSNIINGIKNGISNGIGKLKEAARNAAQRAFDAAKSFLGIRSPSKLFRDKIGKMMAEGMAIGFESEVDPDDYEDAIEPLTGIGKDFSADIERATVTVDKGEENSDVVAAIEELRQAILGIQMVLDTGEIVGSIVDPLNRSFGRMAVIAERS